MKITESLITRVFSDIKEIRGKSSLFGLEKDNKTKVIEFSLNKKTYYYVKGAINTTYSNIIVDGICYNGNNVLLEEMPKKIECLSVHLKKDKIAIDDYKVSTDDITIKRKEKTFVHYIQNRSIMNDFEKYSHTYPNDNPIKPHKAIKIPLKEELVNFGVIVKPHERGISLVFEYKDEYGKDCEYTRTMLNVDYENGFIYTNVGFYTISTMNTFYNHIKTLKSLENKIVNDISSKVNKSVSIIKDMCIDLPREKKEELISSLIVELNK